MMSKPLGLYFHIPFCRHRCAYCDFNTYTGLGDLREAYAGGLVREITQVAGAAVTGPLQDNTPRPAATIFFGGGTPSLMAPALLQSVLDQVRESFALAAGAEITMEANPDSVDGAYLVAVRSIGINRLSLGMQSAHSQELALLERQHDLHAVQRAVSWAREAGFANINLDLIFGLPGQTLASWEDSLRAALALSPDHLSLYCLTVEAGTPLQRWLNNGQVPAPDPDLAASQYELACDLLAEGGWDHYEISNWARPGYACRHNLVYWRNDEYLGFGAGAHGHAAGYRYANVKQPRVYLRRLQTDTEAPFPLSAAVAEANKLSRQEVMSDTAITRLRLLHEGIDRAAFAAEFGCELEGAFGDTVPQLLAWGLLEQAQGRIRLTRRGWFLSNQVFYRFV